MKQISKPAKRIVQFRKPGRSTSATLSCPSKPFSNVHSFQRVCPSFVQHHQSSQNRSLSFVTGCSKLTLFKPLLRRHIPLQNPLRQNLLSPRKPSHYYNHPIQYFETSFLSMDPKKTLHKTQVPENWICGERLDKYIMSNISVNQMTLSRGITQKLLKEGQIFVNGKPSKSAYKVKAKDLIEIPENIFFSNQDENNDSLEKKTNRITISGSSGNEMIALPDQNPIPLEIIHEDEDIIVLNKKPGVLVHPTPGHLTGTLVTSLLAKYPRLSTGEAPERPGVVHRLDKDTSGLIIFARHDKAHEKLKLMFQEHQLVKKYTALVVGKPTVKNENEPTLIDRPILRHPKDINKMILSDQGKEARTEFKIISSWKFNKSIFSLLDIQIHTGRTHQIRVHFSAALGCPIVGDPIYCKKASSFQVEYLLLASTYLEFDHPISKQKMKFSVPLPPHFKDFLTKTQPKEEK